MIVGAIIGIIMSFAIILIRGNIQATKINSTVGLIKNQIRMVRAEAVHKGTTQTISFDQTRNRLLINGTDEIPLPKEVEISDVNINNSTLTFTPRGNCQGNRLETLDIRTRDNDEVGYRIRIIGTTGTPDSFPLHR
jgi:Tfp pilus assembly protein FimT